LSQQACNRIVLLTSGMMAAAFAFLFLLVR
jgi:hypothetical protein